MPLAFTHSLFNLSFFYIIKSKIRLGKYWPIFAILSGLINDFDFALMYLLGYFGISNDLLSHGGFMHTIAFPIIIAIFSLLIYKFNKDYSYYGYMLSIGSAIHILLDFVLGGGSNYLTLFYPFYSQEFRLHILEPFKVYEVYAILDAFLIILLCLYLYFKIKKNEFKFI